MVDLVLIKGLDNWGCQSKHGLDGRDDIILVNLMHCVFLEGTSLHANLGSSASGTEVALKTLILFILGLAGTLGAVVLGLTEIEVFNVTCFEVCVVPSISGHLKHRRRSCH